MPFAPVKSNPYAAGTRKPMAQSPCWPETVWSKLTSTMFGEGGKPSDFLPVTIEANAALPKKFQRPWPDNIPRQGLLLEEGRT